MHISLCVSFILDCCQRNARVSNMCCNVFAHNLTLGSSWSGRFFIELMLCSATFKWAEIRRHVISAQRMSRTDKLWTGGRQSSEVTLKRIHIITPLYVIINRQRYSNCLRICVFHIRSSKCEAVNITTTIIHFYGAEREGDWGLNRHTQ